MLMNVPEDWITVAIMLIVLTRLGVFHATVTMVILETACIAMVSIHELSLYIRISAIFFTL